MAGQSALKVPAGASVWILLMNKSVTLTVKGGHGTGQVPGGAGIEVPNGAKLVICGEGTLDATGGNAANGGDGASGGAGEMEYLLSVKNVAEDVETVDLDEILMDEERKYWYFAGRGGSGGAGGEGGANWANANGYRGHGGAGGTGGNTGASHDTVIGEDEKAAPMCRGGAGGEGGARGATGGCGECFFGADASISAKIKEESKEFAWGHAALERTITFKYMDPETGTEYELGSIVAELGMPLPVLAVNKLTDDNEVLRGHVITGAYRGDDPWDLESYWYAWDGTPLSDYNDSCDVTLYVDVEPDWDHMAEFPWEICETYDGDNKVAFDPEFYEGCEYVEGVTNAIDVGTYTFTVRLADGYTIWDDLVTNEVREVTWVITKFMTVPEGAAWVDSLQPGVWWKISDDRKIVTIGGDGAMPVFTDAKPAPWAEYAESIQAVYIEGSVTGLNNETFSDLPNLKTLNDLPLTTLADMFGGAAGAISGAEPEKIAIIDGKAYLDVSVYTSDTLTNQNWSVATNGVIEVPAGGKQGFFYLMSKPAAPSNRSGRPDTADVQHD